MGGMMKQRLKIIGGFLLVLLGLAGLALPFIPGLLLLTAGAICLAPKYPAVQRRLEQFKIWLNNIIPPKVRE
jgi:uncharacterized membrane protein YbaN (DUF454 family)